MIRFDLSKLELETLAECPICGGSDISVRYRFKPPFNYCICQDCGTLFLNQRMTDKQTRQYYQGLYRQITDRGNAAPTIKLEEVRAAVQVRLIKPYLEGVKTNLEIGSSSGRLMAELSKLGITSVGIEPDEGYRKSSVSARFKTYSDISQLEPRPFDLITSSHSIEHLNHPLEYFHNLVENFSHEGTIFMVETPNTDIYHCFSIHHPFAFTETTLDEVFRRLGLKPRAYIYHNLKMPKPNKYLLALYQKRNFYES